MGLSSWSGVAGAGWNGWLAALSTARLPSCGSSINCSVPAAKAHWGHSMSAEVITLQPQRNKPADEPTERQALRAFIKLLITTNGATATKVWLREELDALH